MAGETILVAGCGYVGRVLAARLAEEGDRVFGLCRSPRELPEGVQPIAADLGDPEVMSVADLRDWLDDVVAAG